MTIRTTLRCVGVLAALAAAGAAQARTAPVMFNVLNASATLTAPLVAGDVLRLDTLVTTEIGALKQQITFALGAGVTSLEGEAAWEISTAAGTGPRLVGVNIDIFDASNALVVSDTFAGTLARFALSTFDNRPIGPGVYTLVATGTGVRDSSLDVTLTFGGTVPTPVPEPATYALMLGGLAGVAALARRRRTAR